MYAVLRTGGKQYRVEPGKIFRVEKLPGDVGEEILLKDVLMVSDGENVEVGKPLLENYWVKCRIVEQGRSRKIIVFKYKRRKGYKRTRGHRQHFTALKVEEIGQGDVTSKAEETPSETEE
ncbi:MAG: 50S ribosomal protein L21 [Deltaproteobacteria bacterium]|nr:MAG: 50S ribosomal protein L21 [Deltaproteobacteria bacterium]RLB08727.1 MAG: 50S ribosomal protein L21 [Deltaproteobacteria bacterium]HEC31485.1 50S ribosomal protein L21 [Deltaproteobacteria bacterium]